MAKSIEEISRQNTSGGKPDSNLSNDALHLGGIPADNFATHKYVQDYHDTKEELLKRYMDQQDALKLEQAKSYTDVSIANQDFSSFAEVKDVQALDNKLSGELEEGLINQKSYTDNKIQNLTNDVNTNFDDVGQAISSLNSTTQELFISVSNGKRNVAAAITDQGVDTASDASFDAMATNIRKIPTGGGELDPYFVNTGDGTAESNDIILGKIAYVKGEKIYGSRIDGGGTDTSDATATSSDILLGKTAYANGVKLYGSFVNDDSKQYPTYGIDTSGATARASDIALGKTAYANGSLIIGTLQTGNLNPNVEEIYKAAAEGYVFNDNNIGDSNPPDGQPKTVYRRKIVMSQNADYVVIIGASITSPTVSDYYIESFPVGENGIYYMASSGSTSQQVEYKKYRYTKQELGIPDDETISDVIFGAPGLDGNSQRCLLIIRTSAGMRFYTYHLKENGIIGKEYNGQSGIIYNLLITDSDFLSCREICCSTTLPTVIYAIDRVYGYKVKKGQLTYSVVNSNITYNLITDDWYTIKGDVWYPSSGYEPYFTKDGKYILFSKEAGTVLDSGYMGLFKLDSNGTVVGGSYQHRNYEYEASQIMLFNSNVGINFKNITDGSVTPNIPKIEIDVFELRDEEHIGEYDRYTIVRDITKTLYTGDRGVYRLIGSPIISPDNKTIFAIFMYVYSGNYNYGYKIVSFDVDEILQASVGDEISYTEYYYSTSSSYVFGAYTKIASNFNCTNIKMYPNALSDKTPFMAGSHVETSDEQILGVKYKGMYFHKIQDHVLTAGQPDVSSGKTFIGWMGYPEVGTM